MGLAGAGSLEGGLLEQYHLAVAHKVNMPHLTFLTVNPLGSYKRPIVW